MAKTRVRPYLESIVLCDDVRHSGNTPGIPNGVYDLIHVRSTLQIPADATFPYRHPVLWLFLRLSGSAGVVSGRVALYRDGEAAPLWDHGIEGPIELWGFDKSAHHPTTLVDVEFPAAGVYWFRVRIGTHVVGEVRLLVE